MQNPFEQLSNKDSKDNANYDEWGGIFECQHFKCRSIVDVARYYKKDKILTWVCGEGHVNKIEGVEDE